MEQNSINRESDILIRFLAHETNEQENALVHQWIESSPENAAYFHKVKDLWEGNADLAELDSKFNTPRAFKRIAETKRNTLLKRSSVLWLAAASVMLIIGFWFLFANHTKVVEYTAGSSTRRITLPDKSVVWLNRNSKLTLGKTFSKERCVSFSGEAYFEVMHDPSHPFHVKTSNALVTVLGTKFNVRAYSDSSATEVTVVSGKVRLSSVSAQKANDLILGAGEKGVETGKTSMPVKIKSEDPNYLSWKTREFVFNNTNIREIVQLIDTIYNTKVVLKSNHPENCNLSGRFNCQSLQDMLDMLQMVLDIKTEKKGDTFVLQANGCQ